jgi:ATP-dependent 26S proteasome regulatory subunit
MALDTFFHNKIESMKLEIIQGQAKLRRLEAQRNDYNSRVRLLREELGLLQQPGSYVGEVVKVMGTKKVLVKVHPEGKYGRTGPLPLFHAVHELTSVAFQSSMYPMALISPSSPLASALPCSPTPTNSKRCFHHPSTRWSPS